MNEVLENIRRRRSVRRFLPEPLPQEALAAVIEAGRQAPCGGNNRTTHFMVIQNQEVLEELRRLAVQEFAKMEVTEDTYRSLKNAILSSKKGTYVYDYRPPALVVAANRAGIPQRHGGLLLRAGEHDAGRMFPGHRLLLDQPAALAGRQSRGAGRPGVLGAGGGRDGLRRPGPWVSGRGSRAQGGR